jgi:hypothetical protein
MSLILVAAGHSPDAIVAANNAVMALPVRDT